MALTYKMSFCQLKIIMLHLGSLKPCVSICRLRLNRLLMLLVLCFGIHAHALAEVRAVLSLDETCTVNILNRTVQANEQGRFALPNVPSFMGQVRARATCLKDGVTVTGQTDYFSVVNNDVVDVGDFYLAEEESLPTKLEFFNVSPVAILHPEQQHQLIVYAHYADQSIVDVSHSANGINYQSSNPLVVVVNANGVVAGISSGNALITARKDGVIAVINVVVAVGGDLDGDGLPDDFEVSTGLDPGDPVDAFEDRDKDGLSALEEFNIGTNLNNADTDGDGIDDGEETVAGVDGFITNPLLADTDGDGIPDGVEITVNSNPTDAGDANYAAALVSVAVTPGNPVLTYNTIDSESSLQLTVTGTMIDGTQIDITSISTGTNYTSSDLSVVSFGLEPGRVFAGQEGTATVTVDNAGHVDTATITVQTFAPQVFSYLNLPGSAVSVEILNNYAYVLTAGNGLHIVNFSNPETPYLLATLPIPGTGKDVMLSDSGVYAYVAASDSVEIVDLSTLEAPAIIGSVATPGTAQDLAVSGNYLYVADGSQGIQVVDVSDPASPTIVGSLGGVSASIVSVDGNRLAFINNGATVAIADITSPASPLLQGQMAVSGPQDLAIRGDFVHVAGHSASRYTSVDARDPANPIISSSLSDFYPFAVALSGDLAFFAEQLFVSAIPYVNIADPLTPLYQGAIDMSTYGDDDCHDVAADFNYVVCTVPGSTSRLYITQTRVLKDESGIPPTVQLTAPAAGAELFQDRPYRIKADASDDIRVAAVNFLVNGEVVFTDTAAPYEYVYRMPVGETGISLSATAVDLAGNEGSSEVLAFNLSPLTVIDENWSGVAIDYLTQDLLALSVAMDGASFDSDYKLTSTGDVVVNGTLPSTIRASELVIEGDLVVDGVALSIDTPLPVQVLGDIRLINGGSLTVPSADITTLTIHKLQLDVVGNVIIDAQSSINLDGKGYPANRYSGPDFTSNTRYGCYGGLRSNTTADCTYGRVDLARFAGSAGYAEGSGAAHGGGALTLSAASLELAGEIRANGLKGHTSYTGGAGGGIHIAVDRLTGAGTIAVRGETWYAGGGKPTAGGGRISIYTQDASGFTGNLGTGPDNAGTPGGSGTAFIRDPGKKYGHLYLDNNGKSAPAGSTPLRQIGRHPITAVTQISSDRWRVTVAGSPWTPTDEALDWGLQGLEVSLDSANIAAARYPIIGNTENTLVIDTADDLSGAVGNELIGVHTFQSVQITDGAWLELGEDRLFVLQANASVLEAGTTISAGQLQQEIISLALESGAGIVSGQPIQVASLTSVGSGQSTIVAPSLSVEGDALIDGIKLILQIDGQISIGGDLTLANGAKLTVPAASSSLAVLHELDLLVGGTLTVDADSVIDLDGKGYPPNRWSGPDFSSNTRTACHGGRRSNTSADCTYGRYERARYAGSSGIYYNASNTGYGGGIGEITAEALVLEGVIRANGLPSQYYSEGAGAGGGLHLDVTTLSGAGQFEVRGGRNINDSYPAGGGGRISVYVTDRSGFTGTYLAAAGVAGGVSGSGTVYIKETGQAYGHLIVDNAGRTAASGSTPIRSVGRHDIVSAYEATPGTWKVEVAGSPWLATDAALGWGVDGIEVDLDASETSSPQYVIASNTQNTLTIATTDDLSGVVGGELVGVHTFNTLTVTGGADVDFGEDRLVVLDVAGSTIGTNSTLRLGEVDQATLELGGSGGGTLQLRHNPALSGLDLSGLGTSTLEFDEPVVVDTLAVSSGSVRFNAGVEVAGALSLGNGAQVTALVLGADSLVIAGGARLTGETISVNTDVDVLSGGVLTVPGASSSLAVLHELDLLVGGTLTVDADSVIDLDGKGYPPNRWSGPDFSSNTRTACHGGRRSNTSADCTTDATSVRVMRAVLVFTITRAIRVTVVVSERSRRRRWYWRV